MTGTPNNNATLTVTLTPPNHHQQAFAGSQIEVFGTSSSTDWSFTIANPNVAVTLRSEESSTPCDGAVVAGLQERRHVARPQISLCLAAVRRLAPEAVSVQTTERYLGWKQRLGEAVNDGIGIGPPPEGPGSVRTPDETTTPRF
jgi:hypothetical protein